MSHTTQQTIQQTQQLLRAHFIELLSQYIPTSALREDMMLALAQPMKLFWEPDHFSHAGRWALLTCFVANHAEPGPPAFEAATVSLAIECTICACDIFDDLADQEKSPFISTIGQPRAYNAAFALQIFAQTIISTSFTHLSATRRLDLAHFFATELYTAVYGQHEDILINTHPNWHATPTTRHSIARTKSGTLMGLACALGAYIAEAPDEEKALWKQLGIHVGTVQQLTSDGHNMEQDWIQQKITFPLALAFHASSWKKPLLHVVNLIERKLPLLHMFHLPVCMHLPLLATMGGRWHAQTARVKELEEARKLLQTLEHRVGKTFTVLRHLLGIDEE